MTWRALALRYAAFALLAVLANLATQRVVLSAGESPPVFALAVAAGTLVGLVVKYALDKRWIFFDASTGLRAHGRKFTLYSVMGVVTTGMFWGTETIFWLTWQTHTMREVGAVLGLAIGYTVKFQLDRRYVFTDAALATGRAA